MTVVQESREQRIAATAVPLPALLARIPLLGRVAQTPRGREALTGGAWTALGYGVSQFLRLASKLIMARYLLGPDAFGIIGLVDVLLIGLQMMSDLGIGTNVVQHAEGEERSFLDTAFTIQALRGVGLWAIAAFLAYPFALFYHDPRITMLVIVAGLSVAIRGLSSARLWVLTRNVQLRKPVTLTMVSEAVGLVVSIIWAFASPTAWAIVGGTLASAAVYAAGSHLVGGGWPRLRLDRGATRVILHFGGWMFLSTATYFLGGQAERLVLGKFISAGDLGCFSVALMIATMPSRGIAQVIEQVFFPMISRVQRENPHRAGVQFRRVKWISLACAVLMAVGFIALGPSLVRVLLRPEYASTGWMLQLLGFRAALEVFMTPTTSMLFACGVSKYSAVGNVGRVVFLAVGLWLTLGRGMIPEAVFVLAVSSLPVYVVMLLGLGRNVKGAVGTEATAMALLLLTSLLTALLIR